MIKVLKNISYIQAKRTLLALQVRDKALLIGNKFPFGLRIELCTPFRKFRITLTKNDDY